MKKILLVLFVSLFCIANAATFDFSLEGDSVAGTVLREFITKKFQDDELRTVGFFYDLDSDGSNEIIGIARSKYFYNLSGYKLFVLRKFDEKWEIYKSDIYFDTDKEIEIEEDKITYYKTIFYNNKKCKATINKSRIVTSKSLFDRIRYKEPQDIEEIVQSLDEETMSEDEVVNTEFYDELSESID